MLNKKKNLIRYNMRQILLIFIISLSCNRLPAQEIYVVNSTNQLKTIDTTTFTVTDLFTIQDFTIGIITDLAFGPDSSLYGITQNKKIIEIDIQNQSVEVIADIFGGEVYTALTCNSNNELFYNRFLSRKLYKFDLNTLQETFLESDISSPGDFTFYKGNLVYPNYNDDFIRAYDGSEIVNIGCAAPQIWTFVNVFEDCYNNTIYAIDQLSRVYEYTLETDQFELVANLFTQAGQIYGGATLSEHMASDCPTETLNTVICDPLATADFNLEDGILRSNVIADVLYLRNIHPYRLEYKLFNISGSLIKNGPVNGNEIMVPGMRSGMYFIVFKDTETSRRYIEKLVVR